MLPAFSERLKRRLNCGQVDSSVAVDCDISWMLLVADLLVVIVADVKRWAGCVFKQLSCLVDRVKTVVKLDVATIWNGD